MSDAAPTPLARRLAARFGLDPDGLRSLGAFESEVVAEPLPSRSGAWTETDGAPPHVGVAFRRAAGRVSGPDDWMETRVEAWGALLGRLQAHARSWTASGPRRPRWREQSYLRRAEEVLPDDAAFLDAVRELRERAARLPCDPPGAGLIHADLHHGNLLLDGESWTAIDFDDAVVGPFAFDLATPLYYAVGASVAAARGGDADSDAPHEDAARGVAAERFLRPFLAGFRRHAPDPEGGADAVETSLAVRQAELAIVVRVKLDPGAWTEQRARVARALRDAVVTGREVVPFATLVRLLG